jgi:hypothetical protein
LPHGRLPRRTDESYDSLSNSAPRSAAQSFLDAFIAEETSACLEIRYYPKNKRPEGRNVLLPAADPEWHNSVEPDLGGKNASLHVVRKEKFEPEALHEQDLCRNCTVFWFTDYLRRLKSRAITILP